MILCCARLVPGSESWTSDELVSDVGKDGERKNLLSQWNAPVQYVEITATSVVAEPFRSKANAGQQLDQLALEASSR